MHWADLLNPPVLAMAIPIVAILSGTVQACLKHRERMAMIEHGMDPDGLKKARMLSKQEEAPRIERR